MLMKTLGFLLFGEKYSLMISCVCAVYNYYITFMNRIEK